MNAATVQDYVREHPEAVEQGQQRLQAVLEKSAYDADFRTQLLENPREALGAFTGEEIPASVTITFIENKADATIVLPPYQDANGELSEEELEAVAGGDVLSLIASTLSIIATIGYIFND